MRNNLIKRRAKRPKSYGPGKSRRKRRSSSKVVKILGDLVLPMIKPIQFLPLPKLVVGLTPRQFRERNKWYSFFRAKRQKRLLERIPVITHYSYGSDPDKIRDGLKKHIEWYEELVFHKGEVYAIKLLKRVRDACLRFAADQEFETINELKLHEDGLPLKVGHLMPLLKSPRILDRRSAIVILDIIKLCEAKGEDPSSKSVTDKIPELLRDNNVEIGRTFRQLVKPEDEDKIESIVKTFKKVLNNCFPLKFKDKRLEALKQLNDIHMSVRKGPNGPALGTIAVDYCAITESGLKDHIRKYCEEVSHTHLLTILKEFEEDESVEPLKEVRGSCLTSRLAIKSEPWCKTRYFAICDWFSQSALLGLHKWIFRWLSKQPGDGTMNQDKVAEVVKDWCRVVASSADVEGVYSFDLSKATDRLPALLQREILSHIFSDTLAEEWYTICTERMFKKPDGDFVKFEVGQPLGVYSSWAMLALTHHIICRTAQVLSGQKYNENKYVVIGDDVSILGSETSKWYNIIMNNILRVEISKTKGFTPDTRTGKNPLSTSMDSRSAELAKRVFINGEELTTVSPETLKSGLEYPFDFPNFIFQSNKRGGFGNIDSTVAPILLSCLNYDPDMSSILTTFPLRQAEGTTTKLLPVSDALAGKVSDVMKTIPWFDPDIPIGVSELETMWRFSIRSTLKNVIDKFRSNYHIYMKFILEPKEFEKRVYSSHTQEYISQLLLNRSMLYITGLITETDLLNFQGTGLHLERLASILNTMLDFDLALKGKPSGKRENQNRMRSRVISKLIPHVRNSVTKAKANWGILLLDAGELQEFSGTEYLDIDMYNLDTRDKLKHETSKLVHDSVYADQIARSMCRQLEIE